MIAGSVAVAGVESEGPPVITIVKLHPAFSWLFFWGGKIAFQKNKALARGQGDVFMRWKIEKKEVGGKHSSMTIPVPSLLLIGLSQDHQVLAGGPFTGADAGTPQTS